VLRHAQLIDDVLDVAVEEISELHTTTVGLTPLHYILNQISNVKSCGGREGIHEIINTNTLTVTLFRANSHTMHACIYTKHTQVYINIHDSTMIATHVNVHVVVLSCVVHDAGERLQALLNELTDIVRVVVVALHA
jgi:hypothetical protein